MAKRTLNKSAWIRAQPASMAAKDVVANARREGISLALATVYTVRSQATKDVDATDLRAQFRRLAIRLGTVEAQRLLDQVVATAT